MKRKPELVENRINKVGLFFEIKRSKGITSKVAIIEIAQALSIGVYTAKKYLIAYNKL